MLPRLDPRQRLRMRRFKMALVSYCMWTSLGLFAFYTGQLTIPREMLYVILGGLYAWAAGAITHEEVPLKTGVTVVVIPSAALVLLALVQVDLGFAAPGLMFVLFAVAGQRLAQLRCKPSLILAAVFTVLSFLLSIMLMIALS